jgi:hypothetical protein
VPICRHGRLALGMMSTCQRQSRRHKLTVSSNDLDNSPASWLDENHLAVDHSVAIFWGDPEFAWILVKRILFGGGTMPTVTGT